MKLQKTTLGLLITALVLGSVVYVNETHQKPSSENNQTQKQKIFAFTEEDIKTVTIETKGKTLQFQRTTNINQPWQMIKPEKTIANEAVISFLVNLLVGSESDRNFKVPIEQLKDYGLDKPIGTIKIQLKNNTNHKIKFGKSDFQDQFIYAQIDPIQPSATENTISLVSKDFQYALDRHPNEWKQVTPTPTPKETPSPP